MKRFAAALCALGVILAAGPAAAQIGVRISGGFSYVTYGDFNDFAEYTTNEVFAANDVAGEIGAIHWIPGAAGEVIVAVAPLVDLGIGGGIIRGQSAFDFTVGTTRTDYEHIMTAYPFTATAYVKLPPLPFARPYVFGGAGAYYVKAAFDETVTTGASSDGFSAELTKWGFGLHGGAGLAIPLAPRVDLDLALQGRWANIKGFGGTATFLSGETVDIYLASYTDDEGNLQFGPEATADEDSYGEGSVDLSGFAFTLAIRVTF